MGFSLESMFEELLEIMDSDKKAAVKIRLISGAVYRWHKYAKECGQVK